MKKLDREKKNPAYAWVSKSIRIKHRSFEGYTNVFFYTCIESGSTIKVDLPDCLFLFCHSSQLNGKTYYLTSYTISLIKLTRAEVDLDERAL